MRNERGKNGEKYKKTTVSYGLHFELIGFMAPNLNNINIFISEKGNFVKRRQKRALGMAIFHSGWDVGD